MSALGPLGVRFGHSDGTGSFAADIPTPGLPDAHIFVQTLVTTAGADKGSNAEGVAVCP